MSTHTSSIRRTYRITIDIEAMISAEPLETPNGNSEHLHYYQALFQSLQAHPALLDRVLRTAAMDSLKEANTMIKAEYGWERASEEPPLHVAIAALEPEAQAYFSEEVEAGINEIYVDGYRARVKQFHISKIDTV